MLDRQARPAADAGRGADEIAKAVDGAHRRILERACEERAGQMRRVVLHVVHARRDMRLVQAHGRGARLRQMAHGHRIRRAFADERQIRPMGQRKKALAPQVRLRVARHRERVDVARLRARHCQTGPDRVAREARVVLDAAEALLLDGRHQLAVAKNRRGHVAVIRVDAENEH